MKLTSAIYSLEKLKKMCITFEDEDGKNALDFVIRDLTERVYAKKIAQLEGVKMRDNPSDASKKSRKPKRFT